MPQTGTTRPQNDILLAQTSGEAAEHGSASAETHATAGHGGAAEHGHNPLAEHPSLYFSGVALFVIALILAFAVYTTRGLSRRRPPKRQALIEQAVDSITFFAKNAIGPGGERYVPLVGTVFAFVLVSNLMGILPAVFQRTGEGVGSYLPAPTANLSMTIAISLVVFGVVQYAGIKENGLGGYLKHFAGPIWWLSWLMFPIEFIGALVKPVSLSIRLFGNIFGEETVIAVLIGLAASTLPIFLPIPFQLPMLMFGVFGSIVQASVYTILTCSYISLSLGDHADHGHGAEHGDVKDEFGAAVPAH